VSEDFLAMAGEMYRLLYDLPGAFPSRSSVVLRDVKRQSVEFAGAMCELNKGSHPLQLDAQPWMVPDVIDRIVDQHLRSVVRFVEITPEERTQEATRVWPAFVREALTLWMLFMGNFGPGVCSCVSHSIIRGRSRACAQRGKSTLLDVDLASTLVIVPVLCDVCRAPPGTTRPSKSARVLPSYRADIHLFIYLSVRNELLCSERAGERAFVLGLADAADRPPRYDSALATIMPHQSAIGKLTGNALKFHACETVFREMLAALMARNLVAQ
jgi:hypothetical protein